MPNFGDHGPRDVTGTLQVVLGAGREFREDQLFGRPSRQQDGELMLELGRVCR
jgi:hypothetical protein